MTEEKLKPIEIDFDNVLKEVGVFGKYQLKYFILLVIPVILTSTHANNYIFSAPDTKYRCKTICDGDAKEFEPIWLENVVERGDRCSMYIKQNSSSSSESSCPADWFDKSTKVPCEEYVFKDDYTFVEEMEIPCEEWKRTLIGTLHSLGTLIALPFVGYISDRFGRRTTLLISCVLEGSLGIIKSLSVNYGMFLAFELIEPSLGSGVYTACYILALEVLVPKTRALAGTIINIFFGTGQAIMGGVAWGFPYWRTFLQVVYPPTILVFVFYWLIEESSRWLLTKKRYQEVLDNVLLAAKSNGKQISDQTMSALKFNAENASKFENNDESKASAEKTQSPYLQVFKSKTMVLRLLKCSFWWITCVFCFYGLSINAVALAGNLYLNFIFAALVEIPAHLLGLFGVSYIGRKWTIFTAFVIGGICNLSFAFIPDDEDLQWLSMTAYLLGKLFVTLAFSSIYLYTSELFPTTLRHSLLAFCSMIGRVGSILAPQTPLLAVYMEELPSILFGSTCLISALLMLTSPETLHLRLPETIEEAKNITSLKIVKEEEKEPHISA